MYTRKKYHLRLEVHYTFEHILQSIVYRSSILLDNEAVPENLVVVFILVTTVPPTHKGVSIVLEFLTRCIKYLIWLFRLNSLHVKLSGLPLFRCTTNTLK